MPPTHSSTVRSVVAVVPVSGELELPVLCETTSNEEDVRSPEYSAIIADALRSARLMVTAVPAPETFSAYQISVVTPFALATSCALTHVAPVWVKLVTVPVVVPLVPITAMSVLPSVGAAMVQEIVVAPLLLQGEEFSRVIAA